MSLNKSSNFPVHGSFLWDTSAYTTVETDVTDLLAGLGLGNSEAKQIFLYLDMQAFVDDAAAWTELDFNVYMAVDGVNYRITDTDIWSKVETAAEPVVAIYIFSTTKPCKLKMKLDVALAGDATVPFTALVGNLL